MPTVSSASPRDDDSRRGITDRVFSRSLLLMGLFSLAMSVNAKDPVTELFAEYKNPCQARSEAFLDDLGQLVANMDLSPRSTTELGWDAVQQMRQMDSRERETICEALDSPAGKSLDMTVLTRNLTRDSRASGCIGVQTYLGVLGLRTVLEVAQEFAQAFCDSTSCPDPGSFGVPQCVGACWIPLPLALINEILSARLDIADKCADEDHSDLMAFMRNESIMTFRNAAESATKINNLAGGVSAGAAQEEDLQQTEAAIAAGFDGGTRGFGAGAAVGPALDELQATIESGRLQQQRFERQAVRARLENALATGVTYSRMQRPRAFDGLLEEVRELVAERIRAVSDAGGDVTAALDQFRGGDAQFNDADYRAALNAYRSAYQALAGTRAARAKPGDAS